MNVSINNKLIQLEDILNIEYSDELINMIDIEIEDDNSFCLSSGIISHNSAQASILGARNPKLHACFPLRGRPINVSACEFSKVKENTEFENIRTIIGLKYGVTADIRNMNFGKIVIASDADDFGHSIAGLIINMFYRLWPEIVKGGRLYRLVTPIVIVNYKKEDIEFFSENDFEQWREKNKNEKYTYTYFKGLGTSTPKQFKNYMNNLQKYLVQFTYTESDDEILDLCFLKDQGSSDKRKKWLDLE